MLRIGSLITAIGALAQFLLGGYMFTADYNESLWGGHNWLGLITIVAALVAAVAGFMNLKKGGNPGLAYHVAGTAVLILVQYALGEIGGLVIVHMVIGIVHMVIGIAILISAIAMTTLAFRKPFARK